VYAIALKPVAHLFIFLKNLFSPKIKIRMAKQLFIAELLPVLTGRNK
jgi:hypothetical protein